MPARSWLTDATVAFAVVPVWMPAFLLPELLMKISADDDDHRRDDDAADRPEPSVAAGAFRRVAFLCEAAGTCLFFLLGSRSHLRRAPGARLDVRIAVHIRGPPRSAQVFITSSSSAGGVPARRRPPQPTHRGQTPDRLGAGVPG